MAATSLLGPLLAPALKRALGKVSLYYSQFTKTNKIDFSTKAHTELAKELKRELGRRGTLTASNARFITSLSETPIIDELCLDVLYGINSRELYLVFFALYQRSTGASEDDAKLFYATIRHIVSVYVDWLIGETPLALVSRDNASRLSTIRLSAVATDSKNIDLINAFDAERRRFIESLKYYSDLTTIPSDLSASIFTDALRVTRPWFFVSDGTIADVRNTYRDALLADTEKLQVFAPRATRIHADFDSIYVEPALQPLDAQMTAQATARLKDRVTPPVVPTALTAPGLHVVIGHPGVGKSSLANYLIRSACRVSDRPLIPCLVELRKFIVAQRSNPSLSLADYICAQIRAVSSQLSRSSIEDVVQYSLFSGNILLIYDGLDEILSSHLRKETATRIKNFSATHERAAHIITSRAVGYDPFPFLSGNHYRIAEFTDKQILSYVKRSTVHILPIKPTERESFCTKFMEQAHKRVDDLSRIPLLLALMVVLFHSRGQDLPDQRYQIYEECSELLFQTWDESREIDPELPDRYRMHQLLMVLARLIFEDEALQGGVSFDWLVDQCTVFFARVYAGDFARAKHIGTLFTRHITDRAWVFSLVGHDLFEFTHRTFLEYYYSVSLGEKLETLEQVLEGILPWVRHGQQHVVSHLCLQREVGESLDKADRVIRFLESEIQRSRTEIRQNLATFLADSIDYLAPSEQVLADIVALFTEKASDTPEWRRTLFNVLRRAGRARTPVINGFIRGLSSGEKNGGRTLAPIYDLLYAARLSRLGLVSSSGDAVDLLEELGVTVEGETDLVKRAGELGPQGIKLSWDCFGQFDDRLGQVIPAAWEASIQALGRADWLGVDARSLMLVAANEVTLPAPASDAYKRLFSAFGRAFLEKSHRRLVLSDDRVIIGGTVPSFSDDFVKKIPELAERGDILAWIACLGIVVDYNKFLERSGVGLMSPSSAIIAKRAVLRLCDRALRDHRGSKSARDRVSAYKLDVEPFVGDTRRPSPQTPQSILADKI